MKRWWIGVALAGLLLSACAPKATPTPPSTAEPTATPTCTTYATVEAAQAGVPFAVVVPVGEDVGPLMQAEVCSPPYDVKLTYRLPNGGTLIARSWSPEGTYELPADPLMQAVTVMGEDGWKGEVIAGMYGLLWEKGDGVIYALVSPDVALDELLQLRIQPAFVQ